jgi:hypothetical protein
MERSPYFSLGSTQRADGFDDFGCSLLSYTHCIDDWLEVVPDSEPLPGLSLPPSDAPSSRRQDIARARVRAPSESSSGPDLTFNYGASPFPQSPLSNVSNLADFSRSSACGPKVPSAALLCQMPNFKPINQETKLSRSPSSVGPGTIAHSSFVNCQDSHSDIALLPTSVLPDRIRSLFSFKYFNAMQSRAFHAIYSTDDNVVVCAPTGSGKTTCFEFAIARLMQTRAAIGSFKVMSPMLAFAFC